MSITIEQAMRDCLALGKLENATAHALVIKLGEEFGEFCEAALKETGYLQHKTLKEDSFGEAADIINTLLAALQKLWPHMSDEVLLMYLADHVDAKRRKYEAILKGR